MDIVDGSALCGEITEGDANKNICSEQIDCLVSVFQLGLACSEETPQEIISLLGLQGIDNNQKQIPKVKGMHC